MFNITMFHVTAHTHIRKSKCLKYATTITQYSNYEYISHFDNYYYWHWHLNTPKNILLLLLYLTNVCTHINYINTFN